MHWTPNDLWVAKVAIEVDTPETIRYKYAVVSGGDWQEARWEEGNSHMLKVSNTSGSVRVDDSWGIISDSKAVPCPVSDALVGS